jgi:hypothetical protein
MKGINKVKGSGICMVQEMKDALRNHDPDVHGR